VDYFAQMRTTALTSGILFSKVLMPDKPTWYGRLEEIIRELDALPYPWVDRATLESILEVGRRRAQQILQPCVTHQVGSNGLADRAALIAHLRSLAAREEAHYEKQRRRRLAAALDELRRASLSQPRVLVEAPLSVMSQELANLPDGVELGSGYVTLRFVSPQEALEKLLALAMAIGNDLENFEFLTRPAEVTPPSSESGEQQRNIQYIRYKTLQ
jgi:hypothetical protein